MAAEIASQRVLDVENSIENYIPYTRHVTDSIMATRSGDLVCVFKVGGRSHQSADYQKLMNWIHDLNTAFKGVASDHLSLWSHVIRRRVTEYPDAQYDNTFAANFDRKYRTLFSEKSLMVNELYLTVAYRASPEKMLKLLSRFERETPQAKRERMDGNLKVMQDLQRTFAGALRRYDAKLLKTYDRNGYVYSEPAEFLASLINGERLPMPVTPAHFAATMPQNRVNFSRWGELGEIRSPTRTRYFGMVEIFEYEPRTEPGHLNVFLEAPYECVLTQSFTALSRYAAKGFFERHRGQLQDSNDSSNTQIDEISYALDQLMAGAFVGGEHHCTVTVYGDSAAETRDNIDKARNAFLDVSIVPKVIGLASEAAFWAQLPANWAYRPRPKVITSQNFLSFSSFHNFMSGKPVGNPWGPAVTMFKTEGGTPLYFNFHATPEDEDSEGDRPPAHTIVIGATGEGKTALLGLLAIQMEKFKETLVVFDKDRGMQPLLCALGGKYFPLAMGEPTGMNPLQLEPTPANLIFLKDLIKQLAGSLGDPVTHVDEVEISRALDTVMLRLDKPLRRLSMLLQSLPNPISDSTHPTVHARLMKWCEGGEFGWMFDNPTDDIDLERYRIYGFDYTEFLDKAEVRTPLMMYLMHRTEAMKDGRRFVRYFDEFWKPLESPVFSSWMKDGLKTDRKKEAFNVFATQEPSDALESDIAKTIIQQCVTQILLPNARADRDDYVKGLKLTDSEFDLLQSLPEGSRKFVIKQGGNCAVATFKLEGFEEELAVLSGSPDRAELLEEIIADVGDDPEHWLPVFVNRVARKEK